MATTTRTIDHDGVRLEAIVHEPEGVASSDVHGVVVMTPSLGRDAHDFDDLGTAIAGAGFLAVAVHPRSAAEGASAPTLHDLASDVGAAADAVLRDHAGHARIHLVGHALGNRVARCLAADRADLLASLTLLAAGGLVEPEPEVWVALAEVFDESLTRDEHLARVAFAFFADAARAAVWEDGWLPAIADMQRAAVAATDRNDWWDAVAPRILVVQGLQDRIAVPENGRRYVSDWQARGVDAHLIELDGAGHALLPEQPTAVADAVLAFLRETPDRPE